MRPGQNDYMKRIVELLRLGLPLVGSSVAGFAIHLTDTLMLGWYNVTSLAAATVATSLFFIIFIFGSGFGMAVLPLVASATAAKDEVRARRVTRMSLWLAFIFFLLALPFLWWSRPLLLGLGQEPHIAELGQSYLRIAVFGLLPALFTMSLRSFLSAQYLTQVQLWITVIGIFLNAGVNYLLIYGNFGMPELGIRGAAIASVLIQILMFGALALYIVWRLPAFKLFQRIWKSDWQAFGEVARMGLPIGLTSLAETGLFTASAIMMGWIGEIELAAHGIALQLTALTFMFHVGMSQAATVLAGNAYGLRDEAALRQIAFAAITIAAFFGILVICVFVTFPRELVLLFLDPNEPRIYELVRVGAMLVIVSTLFQFVDSGQIVALSLLRGVHDTRVPMWIALVSYWIVGLGTSYVFAFALDWGPMGLWFGLTAGLGTAAFSLMMRFWGHSVFIGAADEQDLL